MTAELSGLYSGLSGDLQDLEDRVLDIEGKIVAFPTSDDFDTLSALTTSRFNTLTSSVNNLTAKLASLEVYIVNLKLSHTSLERAFTGHTGIITPAISGITGEFGYWGSFWDTTIQTNAGPTSGNVMTFNNSDPENVGVLLSGTSKIKVSYPGVYNMQFSAQFDKTDGGDDKVEVWFAKNGINLPDSNTALTLHGADGKEVAAWNYMLSLDTNDYLEVYWNSADTNLRLLYETSGTNPNRPAIPSVILTMNQVRFNQ